MTQKAFFKLEHSLEKLKAAWPKPLTKEADKLFEQAQKSLKDLKTTRVGKKEDVNQEFDFLDKIHAVLKTHDLLFLSRHLTYHVVATSDLPKAFGLDEEAVAVLTELLVTTAKRAKFGTRLEIQAKGIKLREGPAIQVRFVYEGNTLTEEERQKILEQFFGKTGGDEETSGITYCRGVLRRVGGQLWIEFPKDSLVALTFYWPGFDTSHVKTKTESGTYKYDITITDFAKIRQRFGIVRAQKLVGLVENFVKSLVRQPVDMVIGFPAQGMVTAIYESQEGSASSVATRISQRLKKEPFRLGSKNVTPHFHYQLAFLA